MSFATSIWLFILPFTVAAAMPGPGQGALLGHVISRGGRASVPFLMGMVLGNSAWVIAATFGLAALALRFEAIFIGVKWIGVVYLVFVAWKLWSSDRIQAPVDEKPTLGRGMLAGAFLSLSNPKALIFYGAVLPNAFDMTALLWSEAGAIIALGMMIDFAVQFTYLAAASRIRQALRSPNAIRQVNRTSAGMMIGCAGWMALAR